MPVLRWECLRVPKGKKSRDSALRKLLIIALNEIPLKRLDMDGRQAATRAKPASISDQYNATVMPTGKYSLANNAKELLVFLRLTVFVYSYVILFSDYLKVNH